MAARKKQNRHRRRRGRFGFLYKLLSLLLILAALLVGSVAFFRVNEVTVSGNSRYSAAEVVGASGVKNGDNLFLVKRAQTVLNILRALPYVEKVSPVVHLPDTLELKVVESAAAAAVEAGDSWWLINAEGKVLEHGDAALRGELPVILGLTPEIPSVGGRLAVPAEESGRLESLKSLLSALTARGMAGELREFIYLDSASTIYFGYGEKLTVAVPMNGDHARLAFALERVVETFQERGEELAGTLDLTYGDEEARILTSRWTPQDAAGKGENQNGTTTPEGAGDTDAGDGGAGT